MRLCALTPRNTTSATPIAREVVADLRTRLKIAVGTDHANAVLLHRTEVRSARKQHDIGAGVRQPRADVAADRASAGDDDLHDGWAEKACATIRR